MKNLITSASDISDDSDEKYMKVRSNSDDDLPLRKALELHNIIILLRSFFTRAADYLR